jgi:hypothetical protein
MRLRRKPPPERLPGELFRHKYIRQLGLVPESLQTLMTDVARQFLGLDLIYITTLQTQSGHSNFSRPHWCLTRKGRTQLLTTSGIRKDAAAEASPLGADPDNGHSPER